jgi:hypothetical protein
VMGESFAQGIGVEVPAGAVSEHFLGRALLRHRWRIYTVSRDNWNMETR